MGRCMICKVVNQKNCARTFHRFPHRDTDSLQKWVDNINKGIPGINCKPGKDSRVCSDHFKESCFKSTAAGVHRRLEKNSIPTIFSQAHCSACQKRISQWPELIFRKFPVRHPKLLQQWVDKITFDLPAGITHSWICSDHFEKSCFVKSEGKIRIKRGSVPTQFEASKKRKDCTVPDEVDDDAASDERMTSLDSIGEICELNAAETGDVIEIIAIPETCDFTVDSNVDEIGCDNNISVTPESDNMHDDREQSITDTPKSKQGLASEIFTPKTRARLFAHDHHYFDSPKTLRKKLAVTRKALVEKTKLVKSQKERIKRMRNKITSLQEVVHYQQSTGIGFNVDATLSLKQLYASTSLDTE